MSGNRHRDIVTRIERSSVERLNEPDLIFGDHGRIEKTDVEQPGLTAPVIGRDRFGVYAVCAWGQYLNLRPFLAVVVNKRLGVLEILMVLDRLAVEPSLIQRSAVGSGNDTDLCRRDDRGRSDRNAEKIRMYGPFTRRQRAKLNALDTALLDERDRVLKVIVRILRPIGSKYAAHRHRLAVDRVDHAELIGTDLDQRHLLDDAFDRVHHKMKPRF